MKKIVGLILPAVLSVLISCNKMEGNIYGFTVQNWKAVLAGFPGEDFYRYDESRKIACVADGVTRDFSDGSDVGVNLESLIKIKKGLYTDHAKDASKICVDSFMDFQSFEQANNGLWNYNVKAGLVPSNYLDKDLAGCVAAGVFEYDGEIRGAFIADSRIAIIDKDGSLRFKTKDEGPESLEKHPYLEEVLKQHEDNSEGRRVIRSQYRNKPNEPFAYGVLTGEKEALHYVREENLQTNSGEYVLVFTDGVGEIILPRNKNGIEILNKKFVEKLLENNPEKLERYCKIRIRTEGSLIVWKME